MHTAFRLVGLVRNAGPALSEKVLQQLLRGLGADAVVDFRHMVALRMFEDAWTM